MALITWNDTFSVKVKQFDDQHKKLVEYINQLHDAMKAGKGRDAQVTILTNLINYTKTHFAAEEALMKQHSYPDFETHKKEHNSLTMQVLDIQKQIQGGAALPQNLLNFLVDWLKKHIAGMDKTYGPYFNGKGVL